MPSDKKALKAITPDLGKIVKAIKKSNKNQRIWLLNEVRRRLHEISPLKHEPVDFVEWIDCESVEANDYNPNEVAPVEMKLLEHSIDHDGYTQPVVTWLDDNSREVIDGFHRNKVCRTSESVNKRVRGHMPVVTIRPGNKDRNDRIASTIRHNRARGKHEVEAMSDIVVELKKRNWSDNRIAKELGMDQDEVLRLCQISGLSEVFADEDFSQGWQAVATTDNEEEFDLAMGEEPEINSDRILHTYEKWECFKAGMYAERPPKNLTVEDCELLFKKTIGDSDLFWKVLKKVIKEWKHSCEHYLTNDRMNRIAWLGQAAIAYRHKIPARFRGGYNLLSDKEKLTADKVALKALNLWRKRRGEKPLSLEDAGSKTEVDLY